MNFPLYQRPNSLVFLDDDTSYLETLALVMPTDWCIRLFTHADDCLHHFQKQNTLWEADLWNHQELVSDWRAGALLIPKILEYWISNTERYSLTQVCVVDFSMPSMTGLDFLKNLTVWPTQRVLLTGKADEMIAVGAFNSGLIDKFVPKQQANIGKYLTDLLTLQHLAPMKFHDGIWRSALTQEQYAVLQESTVKQELRKMAQEKQWVEYVVVPAPFGILALNRQARAQWLQLELRSNLPSVADLALASGETQSVIKQIQDGTHLINTELLIALGSEEKPTINTAFPIGISQSLLGAFFPILLDKKLGTTYHEFLSSLPPRAPS
jgi:CheY-like chemotaxis protein